MSNELYDERARVVIALARAAQVIGCRVGFGVDPREPEWPVLFIDLPTGQVSWHLTADQRTKLAPDIGVYDGQWDGHSTPEKYERLDAWRAPTPEAISKVLRVEWNPIGFDDLPDDEYDDYAKEVHGLLMSRADRRAIARCLRIARMTAMRLPANYSKDDEIAERLMNLMGSR